MAGLDDVLERLVADPLFRQQLAANPSAALAGYDLSDEDRALLASQVTDVAGAGGKLESRTSRASMAGLLGALADASAELATVGEPDVSPAVGGDPKDWINLLSVNVGVNQTSDGVGHDVLLGGAGADDPLPTAPSGSGYNELSLQDTSGRETSEAINLVGDRASDDSVPPPDSSSLPDPIDSISTDDRPESLGLGTGEIFFVESGGGGNVDAPTGGNDGIADLVVAAGDGKTATEPPASVEAVANAVRMEEPPDGADALQWDPGDGSDVAAKGEQIEIESWSPGTPTSSAEHDLPDDGTADLVVGTGSHADGADAAITDRTETDSAEPAGAGPNADLDAPTTADPSRAMFVEYSVNLYQGEVGDTPGPDLNVKGAEPDLEDTPPSDSRGWVYPILPYMEQSNAVAGGGTDAPHDLGATRMTDDGDAGASAALGGPDTEAVEAGGTEAELYAYPGGYAQRFDGVDESAPGDGLDVLIAGHTVHESEDTVREDQAIAIGGDADRTAGRGGGIINDSGTMTLAGSTLPQSDDVVPENETIAVGAGDPEPAGAAEHIDVYSFSWGVTQVPTFVEDGDDATARSLADPAPAATDGWVNVGQTEQFLFDNTDIAEPVIEDVAPPVDAADTGV